MGPIRVGASCIADCRRVFLSVAAIMAICERGDEVIIPVPWVSVPHPSICHAGGARQHLCRPMSAYLSALISTHVLQYFNALMACQLLGVRVVPLPLEPGSGFVPNVEMAEGLINEKTRAILLV